MRHWWVILILLSSFPLIAGEDPVVREYRSPIDSEGFQRLRAVKPDKPPSLAERSPVNVMALNKKGFVHRLRRAADALGPDPLILHEEARIYSPSQSFIAIQEGERTLVILHPQTSVSTQAQAAGWAYAFTGDRGMARISTHKSAVNFSLKPTDPHSAWQNHQLLVQAGSDVYLKYERSQLTAYVIRGRLLYRMEPLVPLLAKRQPGLLETWESQQIQRRPKAPYEITTGAGQVLVLEPGLNYQIGLPHPDIWQAPLLRTSPRLSGESNDAQKLTQSLQDLRQLWLDLWKDDEDVPRLLQEGRYEEAFRELQAGSNGPNKDALEAICLYRLQQESAGDKKRETVPENSPYARLLREESLRSRLRREAYAEVGAPTDLAHNTLSSDEIYLMAGSEQQQRRWRSSLDIWEFWPAETNDADLQSSYKEWQHHLDGKKPLSWTGSGAIGWSDNASHAAAGTAAPAALGHRSSWLFQTQHQLYYLLERSDAFSVSMQASLAIKVFQHVNLADLQRMEAGYSVPMLIQLPWARSSLHLRPFLARLQMGSALGLDRFGYEAIWQTERLGTQVEISWAQEQNLDFAPEQEHRLDALSGEPTGAMDRSVRRNTLGLRWGAYAFLWQSWDYRYVTAQTDDRQRFLLRADGRYQLPYDMELKGSAQIYQDMFAQQRASVSAWILQGQLTWLGWLRLHPYASLQYENHNTADKVYGFHEMQWLLGTDHRW